MQPEGLPGPNRFPSSFLTAGSRGPGAARRGFGPPGRVRLSSVRELPSLGPLAITFSDLLPLALEPGLPAPPQTSPQSLDTRWRWRGGEASGQNKQTKFREMYENNGDTLQKSPGWPFLQHEGQIYVLLTGAHIDVATVLGAGSVVEGEAWPQQAAQHHQGMASLHLDAPGPWGRGRPGLWSQRSAGSAHAPGPGARLHWGKGRQFNYPGT